MKKDIPKENVWFLVVNPNAGNRKIQREWPGIEKLLKTYLPEYDFAMTERPYHALELASKAVSAGYRKFITVGGDGTLNEVVNAIFDQDKIPHSEFVVGLIPVGTGNDWGRMFKIPKSHKEAIETIVDSRTFVQDVGLIRYYQDHEPRHRYFINIAGMGFDAMVAQKTNRQKEQGKGNALSYFYNLFTSIFEYKPRIVQVDFDDVQYHFNIFSMSTGICKFNGGGMMQLPNAIPDDGLLDITVIKKVGLGTLLAQLRNLYTGQFVKHPKVATFRAKQVKIECKKGRFMMEADGESLGHAPFEVTLIQKALKIIVGKEYGW